LEQTIDHEPSVPVQPLVSPAAVGGRLAAGVTLPEQSRSIHVQLPVHLDEAATARGMQKGLIMSGSAPALCGENTARVALRE
jgi:hypothetical protein